MEAERQTVTSSMARPWQADGTIVGSGSLTLFLATCGDLLLGPRRGVRLLLCRIVLTRFSDRLSETEALRNRAGVCQKVPFQ